MLGDHLWRGTADNAQTCVAERLSKGRQRARNLARHGPLCLRDDLLRNSDSNQFALRQEAPLAETTPAKSALLSRKRWGIGIVVSVVALALLFQRLQDLLAADSLLFHDLCYAVAQTGDLGDAREEEKGTVT
jgi:hypothetical protein